MVKIYIQNFLLFVKSVKSNLLTLGVGIIIGITIGIYVGKYLLINNNQLKEISTEELITEVVTEPTEIPIDKVNDAKCSLYVDISGAVLAPGVYCMEEGQILLDAINIAGNFNKDLYAMKYIAQSFNLSQKLIANEKIYVPYQDDVECKAIAQEPDPSGVNQPTPALINPSVTPTKDLTDTNAQIATCVSINNASSTELDTLSGVGPSTAQKIIDGRPYTKLEDLMNVSGIGQATFDKLKSDICL